MTTGVAIIGCGLVGAKRLAALPDDARVVALFDVDRSRAEQLAALAPGEVNIAHSADEAITAAGVQLVLVATPHGELASNALAAVRAGRHVLVEKPGGVALAPLLELEAAAAEHDRRVRVGFNHRFHPALLRARELVEDGGYGGILHLRARYGHGGRLGYEREWRADRARSGGGELVDQGAHLVDLARYLAGDVDLAFAELRTDFWPMEVEDNAFVALRLERGGFAWLHASWTEWKNLFSFEIALARAKIEVTGLGGSYGTESLRLHEMAPEMGPPETRTWEWPGSDESWAAEMVDVLGAIDGSPARGADVSDAIAVFRVIEAAYAR